MGQIGKDAKPGFFEGYEAHLLTVPVIVYNENGDKSYTIRRIYEDEGFLCIDVAEQEND